MESLNTEAEYDIALARVIEIFHAEKGTKAFEELGILIPLVNAYEDLHYPISNPESK